MRWSRHRWALTALALVTLGCAESPLDPGEAMAQTAEARSGPRRGSPDGFVLEHKEALGLSDAQVEGIRGILAELRETNAPLLERLREAGRPRGQPDDATRALLGEVRENARAAHERVLDVLTEEQRGRLEEVRPRRGEGRPHGPGMRGRNGPGEPGMSSGPGLLRLRERLELTDEQVARIRAIGEELRAGNQPLVEELRGSGERPGRDDPRVRTIRANIQAAREEMLAVLTDAQRETLDELRERAGAHHGGHGHGRPRD